MKDYQQLCIVTAMTEKLKLAVQIVPCPTVRETDGLAMSSRNVRLSREARKIAPEIYRILLGAKQKHHLNGVVELENWAKNEFSRIEEFNVEYFQIVDSKSLQPFKVWSDVESAIACTAVFLDGVRLIDNQIIF
jgi:pantoate--beta-alanine ligase